MSFNGSGTFNLYATGNPVVTGTTVSASWANNTLSDIASGLSNCITRDGQSPATANIPMGSHKITGLAVATTTGDALSYGNVATVSDLTASGTVTLSGGTANGVAYLNGSKVLTTGSALTFDGTTLTANGGASAIKTNGASASQISYLVNGVETAIAYVDATQHILGSSTAVPVIFRYQGSEQMRLTSTGLGIGTSTVLGSLTIAGSATTSIVIPRNANGSTASPAETQLIGSTFTNGTYPAGVYALNSFTNNSGNWLTFKTTDTGNTTATRMTLDTSGNLGLGVTPSAWATVTVNQIKNASFGGYSNYAYVNANCYYDGSWKYIASDYANRYEMNSNTGKHQWYTAPSGTAGNAISFTQAMTLDASGRLAVGTTSPVTSSVVTFSGSTSGAQLALNYPSVRSYAIGATSDYALAFRDVDANAERARIDSSGNLLVGATSGSQKLYVSGTNGTNYIAGFYNTSDTGNQTMIYSQIGSSGNSTSSTHFAGITRTVGTWYLYGNGTTSYSSDERLKKNIVTTRDGYLEDLMKLRVVKYNWWNQEDETPKEIGLIAQEVEQVFPGLVQDSMDATKDDIKYKVVKHSVMEFIIIKAIQELKAELDQLKQQLGK